MGLFGSRNVQGTEKHGLSDNSIVQRDVSAASRYQTAHQGLFVSAPGGGSRRLWLEPSGTERGTATEIKAAFRQYIDRERNRQRLDETYIPERTSETQADAAAVSADTRIRARGRRCR